MSFTEMVLDHIYRELWRCYFTATREDLSSCLTHGPIPLELIPPKEAAQHIPEPFELEGWRRLLNRASQHASHRYVLNIDVDDKKAKIRQLAEALGVEVQFV